MLGDGCMINVPIAFGFELPVYVQRMSLDVTDHLTRGSGNGHHARPKEESGVSTQTESTRDAFSNDLRSTKERGLRCRAPRIMFFNESD
jgi:hypothetical protein